MDVVAMGSRVTGVVTLSTISLFTSGEVSNVTFSHAAFALARISTFNAAVCNRFTVKILNKTRRVIQGIVVVLDFIYYLYDGVCPDLGILCLRRGGIFSYFDGLFLRACLRGVAPRSAQT